MIAAGQIKLGSDQVDPVSERAPDGADSITAAASTSPKRTKLLRSPDSVRFGPNTRTRRPIRPASSKRALRFVIPSAFELGNVDEAAQIFEMAARLSAHRPAAAIQAISVFDHLWRIVFVINDEGALNDDEALSRVVSEMLPTVDGLDRLRNGFRANSSSIRCPSLSTTYVPSVI